MDKVGARRVLFKLDQHKADGCRIAFGPLCVLCPSEDARLCIWTASPTVRRQVDLFMQLALIVSLNAYSRTRRYNVTTCETSLKDVKIREQFFVPEHLSLKLCGNERTGIDGSFDGNLQTASERCADLPPCSQSANGYQRLQKSRPPSIAPPNIPAPRPSIGLAPIPPP